LGEKKKISKDQGSVALKWLDGLLGCKQTLSCS